MGVKKMGLGGGRRREEGVGGGGWRREGGGGREWKKRREGQWCAINLVGGVM